MINKRVVVDWLGIAPFLLFALLFLILPTIYLIAGAFLTPDGSLTLKNIGDLFTKSIMDSYWISIKVSVASAVGGALIGFYLAWALVMGGLPTWIRHAFLTFSGVASNFAGVPLAFAFIATIGRLGLVTLLVKNWLGIDIFRLDPHIHVFPDSTDGADHHSRPGRYEEGMA